MSILVSANTRVIPQGMTGAPGPFHAEKELPYGSKMVACVKMG